VWFVWEVRLRFLVFLLHKSQTKEIFEFEHIGAREQRVEKKKKKKTRKISNIKV
jgi:hypothetical protein